MGGGLLHAPSILKSCVPLHPCRLRTREHKELHSREPLSNSSAPVPCADKRLRPPPRARACRTLHGDGRMALLRVLGALHLQLLGRERPIRAARGDWGGGGRSLLKVMGCPPPFLHPDIFPQPQPGHAGGHAWVLGWRRRLRDAAWPSGWDMVDPQGSPHVPHKSPLSTAPTPGVGRLLVPPS